MDAQFALVLVINAVGIGVAVWFLRSRLKAKLAEVEARQARKWADAHDPEIDAAARGVPSTVAAPEDGGAAADGAPDSER